MAAIVDYIGQTYWSSHSPEEFIDKVEAISQGNAKMVEECTTSLPHFAYGFANGFYGDMAIPIVFAGARGVLGSRIQENIFWACKTILSAFHAIDFEVKLKLLSIYALNNKATIAGKIAGSFVLNKLYARLGFKLGVGTSIIKAVSNSTCLGIMALISHRGLIQSLSKGQHLFVFLYVMLNGDNNLLGLDSKAEIEKMEQALSDKINSYSVSELNARYQEINAIIPSVEVFLKRLKGL